LKQVFGQEFVAC